MRNVTIRVVFQNFFIYAIFQIRKTKMMFTRPVSNSDITDFIIDRLDNVKTPDCHVYSKNFLDYMAPIHKVSFAIWSIFFISHIMLSLSLIDIMLIFITHFYQHTFDDVDIAIFLKHGVHKYREYYVSIWKREKKRL